MKPSSVLTVLLCLVACSSPEPKGDSAQHADMVALDASWLVLADMDGEEHDLRTTLAEGREVALVFWQTWCDSCIREAPEVNSAVALRSETTEFFGVVSGPDTAVDDAEVRRMTRKLGMTYLQVRDRSADLARRFQVKGTPTVIVIAPDGQVTFRGHQLPESWSSL